MIEKPDIGLHDVYKSISDIFSGSRAPHAVLFETASDAAADAVCAYAAMAAMCEGDGKKPCGECRACRKVSANIHPDITELRGSGARSLHVDDIRALRQDAYIMPNEGRRRVYIIKNAGDMSAQSQNALLKILEEPPEYLLFILTCRSRSELLETVLSRLQIFVINTSGEDSVEDEQISAVVSGAADALAKGDEYALAVSLSALHSRRQADGVVSGLYKIFTSALMYKHGLTQDAAELCTQIASSLSEGKIRRVCGLLTDAARRIDPNVNNTLISVYLASQLAGAVMG